MVWTMRVLCTASRHVPYGSLFCRFFWLYFEYVLTIDLRRQFGGKIEGRQPPELLVRSLEVHAKERREVRKQRGIRVRHLDRRPTLVAFGPVEHAACGVIRTSLARQHASVFLIGPPHRTRRGRLSLGRAEPALRHLRGQHAPLPVIEPNIPYPDAHRRSRDPERTLVLLHMEQPTVRSSRAFSRSLVFISDNIHAASDGRERARLRHPPVSSGWKPEALPLSYARVATSLARPVRQSRDPVAA